MGPSLALGPWNNVPAGPPSHRPWFGTTSSSEVDKVIAINEGSCPLKMMKCRRRQATEPQKLKKIVNGCFVGFLLVEAIGVKAEAFEN